MSTIYDEELIDTMYLYTYGILYLITVTIALIPIYIVVNYLVLSIGLSRVSVLALPIIQISLIIVISNNYLLKNLVNIDFTTVSKINPVILHVVGIYALLLSLLICIINSIRQNYLLEIVSTVLWTLYLSSHLFTTYLFHKVFNNNILVLSIELFIAVIILSYIIPLPYSYLFLFIPLVPKQYGLRNTIEYIDKAIHGYIEEKGVFEQVIKATAIERREIIIKNILESFRNIGKGGVYLLISSIIELSLILPSIVPYFTYVVKLPVLNIEPSYVLKIILVNQFTNWDLVKEYLPVIIIFTSIYSLVIVLHIICIYASLGRSTTLLSTYDNEYSKLTLFTYISSIIYAFYLLALIIPMFITIQIYTSGSLPTYMGETYSLILNKIYVYVPIIYVFLTGTVSLLITALVISRVSRDFTTVLLSTASNIIPIIIFLNIFRTIALLIDLHSIHQFMWIASYIPLLTIVNLLITPILYIVIAYGGFRLYSELYSELVFKHQPEEE